MVLSAALISGLMVVGAAAPALAAPPTNTQNFYPDDTPKGATTNGTLLSDRFDGVDQLVHLTNVSTADTTRVQWRLCAAETVLSDDQSELTQAAFNACTLIIGEDSSPTTPVGNGASTVDEAYEFNWDIPVTEDNQTRDLVAAACIGAGEDVELAGDNCALDIENDVQLDDASTGANQTSSGEMVTICTVDVGGPDTGESEPCDDTDDVNVIDPTVAARYTPFVHGDNVPNDGFTLRARTSDDVTAPVAIINEGDAVDDPNTLPDFTSNCTNIFTGTNFKEWECEFDADSTPDSAEFAVTWVNDSGTGLALCSGVDCEFDSHYVVSAERAPQSVVATFFDPDEDNSALEQCADPIDAATNDLSADFDAPLPEDDVSAVGERVVFCVTDQFGDPFNGADVTFESTGPSSAGFDDDTFCDARNHDDSADGVDEHADCTTGNDGDGFNGIAIAEAMNPDDWSPGDPAIRGVQTITACVEGEPFDGDPVPAEHGCADEPANLTDSVNKTWESDATVVRLVFGDKSTNCLTGPTFKENRVGDTDNLLACTFDFFGNPTPTTGDDDGFLEWSIAPGNDDEVDTQFLGVPPSETDADGEAVAVIEAITLGSDGPTVCLREDITGNELFCDSVAKNVVSGPGGPRTPSNITIHHRKRPHRFQGRVGSSDASCVSGRTVVLRRARRGPDRRIGTDVTNAAGKYRIRHRRTRVAKRYYTRVNGTPTCRAARSRTRRNR